MHSHLHKSVLCLDRPSLLLQVVEQLLPLPLQWIGGQQQEFLHQPHWHQAVLPMPLHCWWCWELVGICHSMVLWVVTCLLHGILPKNCRFCSSSRGFLFYLPIQKKVKGHRSVLDMPLILGDLVSVPCQNNSKILLLHGC